MADQRPKEVYRRFLARLSAAEWDELADMYAEDVVVEWPMSASRERVEGRAAVRERFAAASRGGLRLAVRDVVIHETADPEVIVGEYVSDLAVGVASAEGITNVHVMRIRDGLIVSSRDYHDHRAIERAGIGSVTQRV